MLELDFAYFNLIDNEKKGLIPKKFWLELLTPIFFRPRLESLIDLRELESKGCNILFPIAINHLDILSFNTFKNVIDKSLNIIGKYDIDYMAVDRNLKPYLLEAPEKLVFGDNFIKALANVLIQNLLEKHPMKKIIVIGEPLDFYEFLEVIASYGLPMAIQNYNPSQYELLVHRMLYENGSAISNSYICPDDWDKGHLVLYFNKLIDGLSIIMPELAYMEFTNKRVDIKESFKNKMLANHISIGINSLAPIMETCLLSKRGFSMHNGEKGKATVPLKGKDFLHLQAIGDKLGLWGNFLDNGI
ncbi:MAG: hypothetical protein GX333_03035 [Syntrophomonadaceae bacterium]|nr:hypothetical protein [Syntrophomonadaceae bacterium]